MGHCQNIWDMVQTYGTKSKCDGTKSKCDGTKSKCDGTKSNRMGQSVTTCTNLSIFIFRINLLSSSTSTHLLLEGLSK